MFKDPELHPSAEEEEYRYAQHNNSDDCPGYRDFLNQALEPTLPYLDFGMEGLDFGCGPNPVLARMLDEAGYSCTYYDPFFCRGRAFRQHWWAVKDSNLGPTD